MGNAWTPHQDETLRAMAAEGAFAADVAAKLRVSKNSVIGRARRAGIKWKHPKGWVNKQTGATASSRRRRRKKVVVEYKPKMPWADVPEGAPPSLNLALMALTPVSCRWPYGGWGYPYAFCGSRQYADGPYCLFHKAAAVRPAS